MSARWRRAIFSNPIRMSAARTHGVAARLPHRARRRCATTGETGWSAGRTRFQLTPDSASGVRVEREICTAGRRRCRCRAGVRHRRRSAAHLHRLLCPRRCRGLTEDVTARAVGQRLWSSGVPPARRQQGRVKSRHAALRSAYRVMAECRRSATMSADVGGDGGGETAPLRCVLIWWREAG